MQAEPFWVHARWRACSATSSASPPSVAQWAEVFVWQLYNYPTAFPHQRFLLALTLSSATHDYWTMWRHTLPRSRVAGVLAKWVNVCSWSPDLGVIEPLHVLAQHLHAQAVLPASDAARLLEVVSAQAAAEAQKRTNKSAREQQEEEAMVSEWTNAWHPNAQTTTTTTTTMKKKDQRAASAEKSSKAAGKHKTTPQPPSQMSENTKLLHEFFAVRPRDLAAALTARHWAIFGPILKLVLGAITTAFRAKHRVRAFKKWVKVAWVLSSSSSSDAAPPTASHL